MTAYPRVDDVTPFEDRTVRWLIALVLYEVVGVWLYFRFTPATPAHLRYLVYPFVWINLAVLAVATVRPRVGNRRHRAVALAVAIPYTLALLYVPGVLKFAVPGLGGFPVTHSTFDVYWAAPGWGPLVSYQSPFVLANLVPFKLVGYLGLGYLVYANVLRTTRSALSGALGLVTCVSCTAPLWTMLAGLLGGSGAVVAAATRYSVDLGTAAFVVSVAVLYWGATRTEVTAT